MAIKQIPTNFPSPDFRFDIELDGTVYGFRFVYNERTDRYAMSIFTETGDEIVTGVAVVSNWKLLDRFKDTRLPPGRLFTMDVTGGTAEPTKETFGDTVVLCYDEATT
jgi:hypothetical protein